MNEEPASEAAGMLMPVNDHTAQLAAPVDPTVRTFFYGRASRDRTGQRSSVTTQEGRYDQLAQRSEWETRAKFIDNDLSASKKGVKRPDFERMLRQIETKELVPDLIVAYDLSRLMRNRRDKIRLEQLIESGVNLYDMRYGIDTRDKLGRIVFAIMAEMAIDRAQELAEYQRDYHDRRRREGKPNKSTTLAYGYRPMLNDEGKVVGFEVDQAEASAIRWAVSELRSGASLRSVINALNDVAHPHHMQTRHGNLLSHQTVRGIVCSARIAGCVELPEHDADGGVVSVALVPNRDGSLPAIVDVEDVLALRERFRVNSLLYETGSAVGRRPKYLLSGIAECCACGAALYGFLHAGGKKGRSKIHRYQCTRCRWAGKSSPSIGMAWLDEFIAGATFERLRSGVLADLLSKASSSEGVAEMAGKIVAEEEELRRFDALVESGEEVSAERYLRFTKAKESRIAELKTQLAAELDGSPERIIPTLPDDLVERIEEYWADADLEWKRRLIRLCWERILINRAPRPGRLSLEEALERIELTPRGATESQIPALPLAA